MARALRIFLIALAALVGAVLLAAAAVLYTPPGRALLSELIEAQLADQFGGESDVGALSGALPGQLVLEEIVLSESGAPWLTVERLELTWRPIRLLRGRVDIERALVRDAVLLGSPPEGAPSEAPPRMLTLPENLPNIRIGDLQIDSFAVDEAVAGQLYRLDLSGRLSMGARMFDSVLRAKSNGDRDDVYVALRADPDNDRLYADVRVDSAPDGLIAVLIKSGAAVRLEASADSPLSDGRVSMRADAGRYGRLDAEIAANLLSARSADLSLTLAPGPALDDLAGELGDEARFEAKLTQKPGGMTVEIGRLAGAFGALDGAVSWTNSRRALERFSIMIDARFSNTYRPALQTYLGESANLSVDLVRLRRDYRLDATISGDRGRIAISDGRTDLRRSLTGALDAELKAGADAPGFLQNGAAIAGAVQIKKDSNVALNSLEFLLGGARAFDGDVAYDWREQTIKLAGAATASPALVAMLAPSVKTQDSVFAQIDLSGPFDRLTLTAEIDSPRVQIGDHGVPPANAEIALTGLPMLPTGDIAARAADGSGRLDLALRSASSGRIAVPRLRFKGEGFALNGAGAFDPASQTLTLDLDYEGDDGAAPLPGITAAGKLSVDGTLTRRGAGGDFTIDAPEFAVNGYAVSSLSARAHGPAERLAVDASIDALTPPGYPALRDLSFSAVADIEGQPVITLNAFEAEIEKTKTRLAGPTTVTLGETVSISGLRAQWGETGMITLDGSYSPARWRAKSTVSGFPTPGGAALVSFDLDLDTALDAPARGVFEAKSLLTRMDDAQISGVMNWDGRRVRLFNEDGGPDAVVFDISLPVRLIRADKLSIGTEGPLDGRVQYSGALEVLAAYLPASLQSLEGGLEATLELGGALDAPSIVGRATVRDAAYTELRSGLSLVGLHADALAERKGDATVISFSGGGRGAGQSGKDTLEIDGVITFNQTPAISAQARFDRMTVSAGPVSAATTSGTVTLDGPLNTMVAAGDLNVHSLDAEIVTPKETGLEPIDVVAVEETTDSPMIETPRPPLAFDVRLTANDRVFIRGRGLESEWSVNARATGDTEDPVIVGSMSLRRGWFDFSGRRFNLTEGRLAFDELVVNDPLITARAEHQTADGVTAIIVVSGRASLPKISLQSSPALPAEDVMALVLFGKPAQELTALESLQTAQALAALSGVGPFGGAGVTGSLRQALGLDLLNLDVDPESGGGSLTVGKYVASGLFVSASQDAQGENGSVRIQYEITNSITVETEMKQDGEQTVSANWKKDF